MIFVINILFAWITVVLVFLLTVIYILRLVNKYMFDNKILWLKKLNRTLRKPHKWLGVSAIITAIIHGLTSSIALFSMNKGTLMIVAMIFLGLTYMFRKPLKKVKGFMFYHRILTGVTVVLFVLHLVEIGGILGPSTFFMIANDELEKTLVVDSVVENIEDNDTEIMNDKAEVEIIEEVEAVEEGSHGQGQGNGQGNQNHNNPTEDEDDINLEDVMSEEGTDEVDAPISEEIEEVEIEADEPAEQVDEPLIEEVIEIGEEEQEQVVEIIEDITETGNVYNDGVYTGVAKGLRDGLTVEVTLVDNQIASIVIVAHREVKENYYALPMIRVPEAIISTQYPVVDTITGATYTSIGIMNATINALSEALVSGELPGLIDNN